MNNIIFVDLDETLIHSYANDMPPELEDKEVEIKPYENYRVALRPGANYLLLALRKVGYVFMLTRATRDYAIGINKMYNFAFTDNRIYSRNDIKRYRYKELHLPKGNVHLIDDLPQEDNFEKVALISQLGPVYYHKVQPFYGDKSEGFTHSQIEELINNIANS